MVSVSIRRPLRRAVCDAAHRSGAWVVCTTVVMEYLTLLLNKLIYGDNTQNYLTMDPRELTHRQCTTAIAITGTASTRRSLFVRVV